MTDSRVELMRMLFPDTAERVDAAYAPFAGARAEAAFDDWIDQRASEAVSYTHLDVYKRQRSRSATPPSCCRSRARAPYPKACVPGTRCSMSLRTI